MSRNPSDRCYAFGKLVGAVIALDLRMPSPDRSVKNVACHESEKVKAAAFFFVGRQASSLGNGTSGKFRREIAVAPATALEPNTSVWIRPASTEIADSSWPSEDVSAPSA